ncbi:hypothetical protein GCM10010178_76850 [Lentzea flava]|uniref:Methyltransferase domain-containing protein n=1 Tax=Lentzea flava TaxID=103732 RepID=A0ABQ2VAX6_9PSEU|nr:hypothetical protein GCM10010178_76850 [Lentzea flava]
MFDPARVQVLESLDIELDWRCLDAGCGRGSIATWLAQKAYRGQTTACEVEIRLAGAPSSSLRTPECDIGAADFKPESFELIHARLLLQRPSNRDQVLDHMVSWLALGGWLVVSDGFDLAKGSVAHPEYAQVYTEVYRMLELKTATRSDRGGDAIPSHSSGAGLSAFDLRSTSL